MALGNGGRENQEYENAENYGSIYQKWATPLF